MSSRKHKRRRVDADALSAHDQQEETSYREAEQVADHESERAETAREPSLDEADAEAAAKEREVWDAFREEHYELLEQLPLSLHRAFKLIHELDQQAQDTLTHVAPAILKYVTLRKVLAGAQAKNSPPQDAAVDAVVEEQSVAQTPDGRLPNGVFVTNGATTPRPSAARERTSSACNPLAWVLQHSHSTRELLVQIAQSAEEVTRACAEKVYLAQYAYDLVDRYIRDLDRAIKEQEASIPLGLRPGTHPASIILPEVIVPQSSRGRLVATPPPPVPGLELPEQPAEPSPERLEGAQGAQEVIVEKAATSQREQSEPASSKDKKGKKRKKSASRHQAEQVVTEPGGEEAVTVPIEGEIPALGGNQAPLTVRIPAQASMPNPIVVDDMPPDPNEPRYCFCNQVSFGDMIACDNPTCAREWFHIGCVGLTKIPKGNWYCRECINLKKRPKSRRKAR
ncbi:hypothetical protein BD414DRAFT_476450 [Trametes punicea]|nr:hypothetical protein BD414DRAFT_476450 [Trametes punicea]